MFVKLHFANGENSQCDILGKINVNGINYAVFRDVRNLDVYIYRYTKKKNKYKLIEITSKDEFNDVCGRLNALVNAGQRGVKI